MEVLTQPINTQSMGETKKLTYNIEFHELDTAFGALNHDILQLMNENYYIKMRADTIDISCPNFTRVDK